MLNSCYSIHWFSLFIWLVSIIHIRTRTQNHCFICSPERNTTYKSIIHRRIDLVFLYVARRNMIYKLTVRILIIFFRLRLFGIAIFLEKLCSGQTKSLAYSASVHRWICSNFGGDVHPSLLFTLNGGDRIWNHFAQVGILGSFFANFQVI